MARKRYVVENKAKLAGGIALLLLALLLLIGAVVGIVFLFKSCGVATSRRSLPFNSSQKNAYTGDGFIYIEGNELRFFSLEDEDDNYSVNISIPDSDLIGTPSIKVVYKKRAIRILGTQFDNEANGDIIKICCGKGFTAFYRVGDDGVHSIRVFDSAGSQCYQKDFSDTVLLNFGFESMESSVLWISELVSAGDTVTSSITTYDLNRKSITGVISVQGQISGDVFISEKSIFVMCTDNIIRFERETNKEAYRILTYGYECESASFKGSRGLFVLKRLEGKTNSIRLLSLGESAVANERASIIMLDGEVLEYASMRGRFVAVMSDKLCVYDEEGKLVKSMAFERPITSAKKLDERNIYVTRGDEALIFTVK